MYFKINLITAQNRLFKENSMCASNARIDVNTHGRPFAFNHMYICHAFGLKCSTAL